MSQKELRDLTEQELRHWKAYEFIKDKKKYNSVFNQELDDKIREVFQEGFGDVMLGIYWFTHDCRAFEKSPYEVVKNGHKEIVIEYLDSTFVRCIPD